VHLLGSQQETTEHLLAVLGVEVHTQRCVLEIS
jgi:hypothetical protein